MGSSWYSKYEFNLFVLIQLFSEQKYGTKFKRFHLQLFLTSINTLIVDRKTISVSQNKPDAFRPFCLGLVLVSYITVTVNAKSERFLHKWLDLAWGVVKLWLQYDYRQSFSLRKTTICIERNLSETVFGGSYPTIPWLGRQLWHKEFSQVTELKVLKSESPIKMHKPSSIYLQSNRNANWYLL